MGVCVRVYAFEGEEERMGGCASVYGGESCERLNGRRPMRAFFATLFCLVPTCSGQTGLTDTW